MALRLKILNSGYEFGTKALFAVIRAFSGYPLPDAGKLIFYRPDFYGSPMKEFTHAAMRGPSEWSVGDRELMAAYVSKSNECEFCIMAHSAVAARAYDDKAKVAAVFSNLETAPIGEPLRAILYLLGKLTREQSVSADDIRAVLAAGVSGKQIEDALAICFTFNTTNRLADAFDFVVLDSKAFEAGAKYLLSRGYR
jgi:uncharacterized peroxidase-related enzyme